MADALHILMVIDNFHPLVGGAEQATLESARALVARGHQVDVLTMRKQAEWPTEETLDGARIIRFDERVPPHPLGRLLYERWNAAAAARAFEQLDAEAYDAILLHPIDAAFGVARAAAGGSAARVYCFHAPLGEEARTQARGLAQTGNCPVKALTTRASGGLAARYREREQRRAIARSDAVTCPSEYSRTLLAGLCRDLGAKPVEVVPWGVDAERFCPAPDRQATRASLGWLPDQLVLLTARRLVPRMGLEQLIQACGIAVATRPRLRLEIVGKGPLHDRLQALAEDTQGSITLHGFVEAEELLRRLQAADLFVLPSTTLEAFGLTILESMACGTPVLATRHGAPPELLGPMDARLLADSNEPQVLADAIVRLADDVLPEPGIRERCRRYATEHYSWERTAEALERVVCRAIARRRGGQ